MQFSSIDAWLASLKLDCYAQMFRAHEVDLQVLRKLTPQDLTELGVASVGHRRRLLHAIASLDACDTPTEPPSSLSTSSQSAGPAVAERRLLSVLFCDMVGSTALSNRLDPEDMRAVIRAYHGGCTNIVKRHDGHVANFIGDGLLVYFGWPQAHDDDAERAVRAGLELAKAVSALTAPTGEALRVRIGVATGPVVVGNLIREGPAQEHSAVGATPHLAAQLQTAAAPGQLIIDGSTRKLLGPGFAFEAIDTSLLAGGAGSEDACAVVASA